MKLFASLRRAIGACAVLAMAVGCGGSQSQTSTLFPGQSSATTAALARLGVGSSMASEAQTHDLLYVADAKDGSVYIYSYPEGAPQGRLLGIRAAGLCAGKNGDVFIPSGNEVLHYAHGGTRPIAVLSNAPGGAAQFCAVDPETGNLAVSGGPAGQSSVAVYAGAHGSPEAYSAKGAGYSSTAYDDQGNLFVGTIEGKVVVLPKDGKQLQDLDWNGTRPAQPGSLQWDGKYLALASNANGSEATTIARYSVTAAQATFAGQSALKGVSGVSQFWIHGGKLLVAAGAGVASYGYPAGGSPSLIVKDVRTAQAVTVSRASQDSFAITTYHYDSQRTGWNNDESTLNYTNVNASSFGELHTVALDDQVDTQPLVVPNITTTRGAKSGSSHDVVYVETENNSIYAIDASSGAILFQTNLGAPVPSPLGCNNNGPNVGINGTPVIDQAAGVMYVVAYTLESSAPTYRIHELSLSNLADVVPSVIVSGSHELTDGSTYNFNATYQRQRPGLLEANGTVYVGFGSFCDYSASVSRGWLLGWQTGSLTPLAANRLNDSLAKSPDSFFLSSIWMSGYGVAADPTGNVYFVTGNSDYSGTTYNGVTNVQESVVKVSADLTQLLSIFTPSDQAQLDAYDEDFGSGGVLLLPTLGSSVPMAAAIGKAGTMYLLNQNKLGGYSTSRNHDLGEESVGGCWCGPSYFAVKKAQRIVASGGNSVTVWGVRHKSKTRLVSIGSASLPSGQDPGFFTTVSSKQNGRNAIIWALARPEYAPGPMTLFALQSEPSPGSSQLQTLFQEEAGYWASANGDADIVPVVANGKVYVATYQQLEIFGLGGSSAHVATGRALPASAYRGVVKTPNEVTGKFVSLSGSILTLRARTGALVRVNDSYAVKRERNANLIGGRAYDVRGAYDAAGVMHAVAIVRAKPSSSTWPSDR